VGQADDRRIFGLATREDERRRLLGRREYAVAAYIVGEYHVRRITAPEQCRLVIEPAERRRVGRRVASMHDARLRGPLERIGRHRIVEHERVLQVRI
jgi:hypothetical protein